MEILQKIISEDIIYALGWAVLHSLWQAFGIAILLGITLHFFQKSSAKVRYESSLFALFLVLVSALSTFIWYFEMAGKKVAFSSTELPLARMLPVTGEADPPLGVLQMCIHYFNTHLPMIVLIWLVGVAFFVLRLLGGLAYVQRLKHYRTNPLPAIWEDRLMSICRSIPLKRPLKILESAAVKVPMVIGHLKPYILLPVGTINQLEANEVEAIIAHEVAHIYRNDFLMNIFISFAELIFYFNPAVWWISGNIRLERENCCDDIAIKVCGNSLSYAKALVRLQELSAYTPRFAMPFSGQRNHLLYRIQRILKQPQNRSTIMERLMATLFLLFAVVFMSVNQNTIHQDKISSDVMPAPNPALEVTLQAESTPASEKKYLGKFFFYEEEERALELEKETKVIVSEIVSIDDRFLEEEVDVPSTTNVLYNQFQVITAEAIQDEAEKIFVRVVVDTVPEGQSKLHRPVVPGQRITHSVNSDGQRIIIISSDHQEDVKIAVGEGSNSIIVNGAELAKGDTTVVIGKVAPGENVYWMAQDASVRAGQAERALIEAELAALKMAEESLAKERRVDVIELREEELSELKEAIAEERAVIERNKNDRQIALLERERAIQRERGAVAERRDQYSRKEQAAQERYLAERYEELAQIERAQHRSHNNSAVQLGRQLESDGIIDDPHNFKYQLTTKQLKVNGKKQSADLHKKYLNLYQELTGGPLEEGSKYEISLSKN